MGDETRCLKLAKAWLKRGAVAIQEHEARIRAEAAAERTREILEILRRHNLRDCSPGYLADTVEMAFPKPGSTT